MTITQRKTVLDQGGVYRVDERFRHAAPGDVRVEYCIIDKSNEQERTHWASDRVYLFLLCEELNKEDATIAALRVEVERAKSIIENYELDYDRVVVRGEKCAMEQAVEEAATLRAEVERLKEQNGKLANSLAVRNQECNAARSAMLRTTTDSLKDYVNYKEARAATDADGGCE